MPTPEGFPTIKEEIDRKALATMIWLVEQHEAGAISDDQLYTGECTLFMVVSGLVSQDIFELISASMPEMESMVQVK